MSSTAARTVWTLLAGAGIAVAALLGWQALHPAPPPPPAAAPEAAATDPLHLAAEDRRRLGIVVTRLALATAPQTLTGFARAIDVGPLAAIDSEIETARAAAAASAADAARLQGLAAADQSASSRAVQAAQAQAVADRVCVDQAMRRTALEFGPGLARLTNAERGALVGAIAAGQAALLRIDVPGIVAATAVQVGDPPTAVTLIGPAIAADPRLQGTALLAILRGPAARGATTGRLLPATVSLGIRQSGTIVPRAAVVRWQGQLWVYVPQGQGFERRVLAAARPVAAGWFTATDLAPGDPIVTAGAGALLAAERGGAGDDEG